MRCTMINRAGMSVINRRAKVLGRAAEAIYKDQLAAAALARLGQGQEITDEWVESVVPELDAWMREHLGAGDAGFDDVELF